MEKIEKQMELDPEYRHSRELELAGIELVNTTPDRQKLEENITELTKEGAPQAMRIIGESAKKELARRDAERS